MNRRVRVEGRVGESDGVEGSLRGDAALGYRFDLDPWYGFFVRGGVRGRIFGNDRLFLSALEVPQAQLGFHVLPSTGTKGESPLGPISFLELAARGSAGLVARAEVDTRERHLAPTPAFGGHAGITVSLLSLNADYTHFLANGASSVPIDDGAASLCVAGKVLSICANGEVTWTAVLGPGTEERRERILMYGATLSVSFAELLHGSGF